MNANAKTLVMLPIDKLEAHPDNPRKNLGDLTELADSIKKNGVMQNLTVVPHKEKADTYTLIIGHRRCAAAKRAGLTELPCAIVKLTDREQIGIMLCENMQRSDITAIEQAESMQLMLDLGETVESIAASTGFSKKTVKDRLKLNKLDKQKLKKACDRQVSLTDLLKISEIKDDTARNEVLSKAGTNNFNDAFRRAKDNETLQESMAYILKRLSSIGSERVPHNATSDIYRLFISARESKETISKKLDEVTKLYSESKLSWRNDSYGFAIFSKSTVQEQEKARENAARNEFNDRIDTYYDKLVEISKRHYELRLAYVREIHLGTSAYCDVLLQTYLTKRIENTYGDTTYIRKALNVPKNDTEAVKKIMKYKSRPEDLLFLMAYGEMRDTADGFFKKEWKNGIWHITPKTNQALRDIYDFLGQYGYEMSDDEIDMREGRHEIYREYLAMIDAESI